jgi:hypothetical protein
VVDRVDILYSIPGPACKKREWAPHTCTSD